MDARGGPARARERAHHGVRTGGRGRGLLVRSARRLGRVARRVALVALGLALIGDVSRAQEVPPDAFANRIYAIQSELAGADELDEARLADELLAIRAALAPLVEGGYPHATKQAALAALALADRSETARFGRTAEEWLDAARADADRLAGPDRAEIELELAFRDQALGRVGAAREGLAAVLGELGPVAAPWGRVLFADLERQRGSTLDALRELEEAERRLDPSTPFHARVLPVLLGLRGVVYLELGVHDEAARWFEAERAAAERTGDPALQPSIVLHRVALLLANGQAEALREEVARALDSELFRAGDPRARATLVAMTARSSADQALAGEGHAAGALDELRAALEDPALSPEERLAAELAAGRLLVSTGRLDEASAMLDAAEERARGLNEGLGTSGRARDRGLLAAVRVQLELARGAARDDLRFEGALAGLERAFGELLVQWERAPRRRGGIGFLDSTERGSILDVLLVAQMEATPGEAGVRRAFAALLRAQRLGTLSRDLGAMHTTIEELQRELLSDSGGALVYFPALERSHLFALDDYGIEHRTLPSIRELEDARRSFQAALEARSTGAELDRLGSRAAERLLPQSLRARIHAWEELTVVGAESLGFLPFEALPVGDAPLGARLATAYLPSLPLGIALTERIETPVPAPRDLLVLAAPVASDVDAERFPGLAPLELRPDEQLALAGGLEAPRVELVLGEEATVAALADRLDTPTAVLHLFAHGVRDRSRERSTGLLLSAGAGESGVLWPDELELLDAPPLVLLSACGAARGPLRTGDDGVAHLGGAFLRAGAASVVLARTDLELASTHAVAVEFTRRVLAGETPARALFQARARHAELDPDTPVADTLLHAFGLAHRPLFPRARVAPDAESMEAPVLPAEPEPPHRWSWYAGLAVALVLVGLALSRARRRARTQL